MPNGVELLERLHRRNFPSTPWDAEGIDRLIEDYELRDVLSSPDHWFVRVLNAAARGQNLTLFFDEVGSDLASLLVHLADDYGWDADDYGEGAVVRFPKSRMRIFISREARDPVTRRSCDSAVVTHLV
ncbi:hypothetical protein [Limnoglobus roseus]|uniref:Uncharacterized protein n=1 Tax=Limnoglobus roseus TaxID=2598579 RepID=A0A5C1ASM7_9BACT|nr:hypothetical protein [Limnoglobus roseus]QEL21046.1 hypothetical protein PX52LOC_08175 [Limnoglobus roseus]